MSIDLSKFWLGLDMPSIPQYTETSYPRYNVIESNGNYRIEIAVPGWMNEKFVHQGLSLKSFERRFILNPDLQVENVNLQDGLLTISLSRTPNSKRKILEINNGSS